MPKNRLENDVEDTLTTKFPFKRNFINRNGHQYHYVNEGLGSPVVMVHGNPSWSFYYRNLVSQLSQNHQCIVPDHIGCGLSDKPGDDAYDYTLANRIDDLDALLTHLQIKENITLVVHDWGGMIGMGYAARYPERIKRLVILNTGAFHLPKAKKLPPALWLGRNTFVGTLLVRGLNAFSSVASYIGVKRKPMAKDIRQAYVAPFNSWKNRISTLRFIQDIPLKPSDRNYSLVSDISDSLAQFTSLPMLICWGLKDFVFDKHFLDEWQQRFPQAHVHAFADCGHYILEDASDEVVPLINDFLVMTESGLAEK
ncbi:alpha/beta fold hydrolase [Colwellia ponticola]|uniref:Alpha/beta fold hydrolase n=1 Tax=Colwellia ponticola TaxID=2304625 RepID=A0A8H2JMU8_9GAMM|nr:alpha/beta fold hydrolase [Colwellia ponticola]TMM46532.1 alpha/beta fold hydrolase [Colwellia ponticola]